MSARKAVRCSGVLLAGAAWLAASSVGAAETALTPIEQEGQRLYRGTCEYCHGERVWGTLNLERRRGASDALLEKRTDLTPELVKAVVRNGIGSMPAYRRTELTDAEVAAIAAYLTRRRQ